MARKKSPLSPAAGLTVSELGKTVGLSRSALLHYDRIGLLRASGRSASGYRVYGPDAVERLKRIAELRSAGMPLEAVIRVIESSTPLADALQRQLTSLNEQIGKLRAQQRVVISLLQKSTAERDARILSKDSWTAMFHAIGLTDDDMRQWHAHFERSTPEAHRDFLESLGLGEGEVQRIREWSLAS